MSPLQQLREKQNLTQEELAEKSGVSTRTIQRIEAGTAPKGHTLKALAKALDVDSTELVRKENQLNILRLKLINLSSLPLSFLPFISILPPLIIMLAKNEFNTISRQIISIQILWSTLSVILFVVSSIFKNWVGFSNKFSMGVMIVLVLVNVIIIISNAASLDRKHRLRYQLKFSFI